MPPEQPRRLKASPTKDFFVNMITRDITLEDCILDLIDNCLDGARRKRTAAGEPEQNEPAYAGYRVALTLDSKGFRIEDNCGGISISHAIDYAFRFGRDPRVPPDKDAIGLYGIGMKRALLKIGRDVRVHSSTGQEAFRCVIDVDEWLLTNEWFFDMEDAELIPNTGTSIEIRRLNAGVGRAFADDSFVNLLSHMIERDYAQYFRAGFSVSVNGTDLSAYPYILLEGGEFKSYRHVYEDEEVDVEVIAGMAAIPPSDVGPSDRPETDYYGWYVLCNDRVVLPADKTKRTVWGDEQFQRWHPQYNGFMGFLMFRSEDPSLLPWTTTKRDVEESSPLYRRAVVEMKKATRPWIDYTNQRKADLDAARDQEAKTTKPVALGKVKESGVFRLPSPPQRPRVRLANIAYQKPVSEVTRIRKALARDLSYRAIGAMTFDYFVEHEVED